MFSNKRIELEAEIRTRQEEVDRLGAHLSEASAYDSSDKLCAFFDDDSGIHELDQLEKIGNQQAELKRVADRIRAARAQIETMLRELETR